MADVYTAICVLRDDDTRRRTCAPVHRSVYGSRVFVVVGGGGSGCCCAYCFFARRRPEMGCTAYFRFYGIPRLLGTMAATIEFHASPLTTKKYIGIDTCRVSPPPHQHCAIFFRQIFVLFHYYYTYSNKL